MRWLPWIWVLAAGLGLAGCDGQAATTSVPPYPTLDTGQVALGRKVSLQFCASCHGPNAEGAPNWATPGPDGLPLAPPHDNSGHTWHHPDRVLYETIYGGMADPLRPGSPLRMPAFGEVLAKADIDAVIAYFKSLWSEEDRLWQWHETLKDAGPTPNSP